MDQDQNSKSLSRRDFLKVALVAGGGLAIAGCGQGSSATTPDQSQSGLTSTPTLLVPLRSGWMIWLAG
jgi:hypothetical protein